MDDGFALMEKTMSKTNDVSTIDHRPLADSELDAVSGGDLNATTNLRSNLDSAFARRFQMVIDFPRR